MTGVIGVGIDLVDVERFRVSLHRTPSMRLRMFTEGERAYAGTARPAMAVQRLAARFAAKEAIAKALGAPAGMRWHDCTVHRVVGGPPVVEIRGTVAARAAELGITRWHLSISHDAGIASAVVVAES